MSITQEEFNDLVDRITGISDHDAQSLPHIKLSVLSAWVDRNLGESKHDRCREEIALAQAEADSVRNKAKLKK